MTIVWSDRNNKVLMDSLQVLQNRAAKIVLYRPVYSSSTQALLDLKWKELRVIRRIHMLIYGFKCLGHRSDESSETSTAACFSFCFSIPLLTELQNRAVRVITKSPFDTSSNLLLAMLNWAKLSLRREKQKTLIMFLNIIKAFFLF